MLTVGSNMVIVSLHIYCERNGIPLCLSLSYYPVLLYYITKNLLLRNVILFFLLTFATLKVTISILPYLLRNVCINYNIFIIIQNMFLSPLLKVQSSQSSHKCLGRICLSPLGDEQKLVIQSLCSLVRSILSLILLVCPS